MAYSSGTARAAVAGRVRLRTGDLDRCRPVGRPRRAGPGRRDRGPAAPRAGGWAPWPPPRPQPGPASGIVRCRAPGPRRPDGRLGRRQPRQVDPPGRGRPLPWLRRRCESGVREHQQGAQGDEGERRHLVGNDIEQPADQPAAPVPAPMERDTTPVRPAATAAGTLGCRSAGCSRGGRLNSSVPSSAGCTSASAPPPGRISRIEVPISIGRSARAPWVRRGAPIDPGPVGRAQVLDHPGGFAVGRPGQVRRACSRETEVWLRRTAADGSRPITTWLPDRGTRAPASGPLTTATPSLLQGLARPGLNRGVAGPTGPFRPDLPGLRDWPTGPTWPTCPPAPPVGPHRPGARCPPPVPRRRRAGRRARAAGAKAARAAATSADRRSGSVSTSTSWRQVPPASTRLACIRTAARVPGGCQRRGLCYAHRPPSS